MQFCLLVLQGVASLLLRVHSHKEPPVHSFGNEHSRSKRRLSSRRLDPTANIANAIEEEIAKGIKHPRFTLSAAFESNAFVEPETFEVHVVMTDPSVNEVTTFSIDGDSSKPAVVDTTKLLIADHHADLTSNFAILTVDEKVGTVSGIVQKDNRLVKWVQIVGGSAILSEANYDLPKDWTCTVDNETEDETPRRRLGKTHHHGHQHNHYGHSHNHFNPANIMNVAKELGLDNVKVQSHRRIYATDTFPNEYSYQVDLYVEVDTAMVTKHDPNDTVNMPNTIAYVNAVITAVSSIYEREVDTKREWKSCMLLKRWGHKYIHQTSLSSIPHTNTQYTSCISQRQQYMII